MSSSPDPLPGATAALKSLLRRLFEQVTEIDDEDARTAFVEHLAESLCTATHVLYDVHNADLRFHLATDLYDVLRQAADEAAGIRSRAAAEIVDAENLSFKQLADRLSKPGRTVVKSRAHQLVDAGRAAGQRPAARRPGKPT